jgi:molybdate transport system substrate-binding protein
VKAGKYGLIVLAVLACDWTSAADITVVSTSGVRGLLEQIRQDFEHGSAHRLNIKYDFAAVVKRQLDAGDSFDVAILPRAMIDDLANQGKVVAATSATVARTGTGIVMKAGAAKPFLGTRDALRSALLASNGIAYTTVGHSAAAAARLFDGLGIAKELKDRVFVDTRPAGGVLAVAEGKAAMGIALIEEIAADPQVELVAPLPNDLQTFVVFAAGVASGTKEPDASRAFIAFLGSPEVHRSLEAVGME